MVEREWSTERLMEEVRQEREKGRDPLQPMVQWMGLQTLEKLRVEYEYEDGDSRALMIAVRECAVCKLVFPEWVAKDITAAVNKIVTAQFRSWDDVLGRPVSKGVNLKDLQIRREKSTAIYFAVLRRITQGQAISSGLFEEVGKENGVSRTWCSEAYYRVKKEIGFPVSAVDDAILRRYTKESGGFGGP